MWNTKLTDDAKRPIRRPSGIVAQVWWLNDELGRLIHN
jgi:hypothetical protein